VRAPFRARVGMVDLHLGQYLEPGTQLTTLQGVEGGVHVDFAVPQDVAAQLEVGGLVDIGMTGLPACKARIVAIDARVEAATRNAWVRALLDTPPLPRPGASVRVSTPVEATHDVLVVPVSALRRGPGGEFVFTIAPVPGGKVRAHMLRVVAGAVLGDEVVVEDGLKVGDRIATTGSFKLYEGALVAINNNAGTTSNAASKPQ
jgi:membrane fusion protein (multidrug efflux system)